MHPHHRRSISQTSPKVQFNITSISPPSSEGSSPKTPPSSQSTPSSPIISPNASPNLSATHSQQQITPLESASETIVHRYCPWCGSEFKFGDVFCSFCGNRRTSYKVHYFIS